MDHATAMQWMTRAEAEVVFEHDEEGQDGEVADSGEVAARATSEAKHTTGKAATRAIEPREQRSRSKRQKKEKVKSPRRRSSREQPSDIPRSSQGHRERHADLARRDEVATPEFQMQPAPAINEGTITMRRGELQMILDSVKRASLNARNAERLSDSAAVAFRQEAIALEAAGAYLTQYLMR